MQCHTIDMPKLWMRSGVANHLHNTLIKRELNKASNKRELNKASNLPKMFEGLLIEELIF